MSKLEHVRRADESSPGEGALRDIERTAVDLARLAGTAIVSSLGRTLAVRYKAGEADQASLRDPVSEVDHEVELLIRAHLADRFPGHDVLGEESTERPGRGHDYVWAVDPVDGTTNFVNGFPLFAASIGVLYRGRPVAGAVWCATSHALRPGVYHARAGGPLSFDDETLEVRSNPSVRRRLAGERHAGAPADSPWEIRTTGSAAIECAFVAAGLMEVARFRAPNVWDVAGGIVLVRAAGGDVRVRDAGRWGPLDRFDGPSGELRGWQCPLVLGTKEAVARLCGQRPSGPS
jgi:myo-inositol-1(or 4)-monophosphatase